MIKDRGAEGRGEQRRRLHTKALMRDLGTRLECRHRGFIRTGKTLCKLPSQIRTCYPRISSARLCHCAIVAHDYATAPSSHHGKMLNRCLYYYLTRGHARVK